MRDVHVLSTWIPQPGFLACKVRKSLLIPGVTQFADRKGNETQQGQWNADYSSLLMVLPPQGRAGQWELRLWMAYAKGTKGCEHCGINHLATHRLLPGDCWWRAPCPAGKSKKVPVKPQVGRSARAGEQPGAAVGFLSRALCYSQ